MSNTQTPVRLAVYAIQAYGSYGEGIAIVAATDKDQALMLAAGLDGQWNTQYTTPEKVDELPVQCDGEPRVLVHYARVYFRLAPISSSRRVNE